jgi:hypothetical protein
MMRASTSTPMFQQTTSLTRTAVRWWRQSLVIAGAAGVVLTGITTVAEARAPQQDAPSVAQIDGVRLDRFDPIGSNKARFYASMKNALPRC